MKLGSKHERKIGKIWRQNRDLSGIYGMQIIKSETKLVLRTHNKTFKRLADM